MNTLPTRGLLTLRDVSVTYADGHTALHRTDLSVQAGEFLVLLGASGAGKSTLLRSINGLVTPSTGQLSMQGLTGTTVCARNLLEHRRHCAMVFQQHHLIGRQSVLANVLMGKLASRGAWACLRPWRKADKYEALTALERVGLVDKALARADTLSGGQQQRVGIARAIVQRPRLLLADEPVASLDPATAHSVMTLLHEICKKDRLTAIVSLHQVALTRTFADRIVGLRQGRVVFQGSAEHLTPDLEASLYAAGAAPHVPGAAAPVAPQPFNVSHPTPTKELQPC